jgi:hypothetical protein
MRRIMFAILFAVLASPLLAQAPHITTAGDPSVRNDTIYRLAVNPADYPDDDYIYLLDDGVIRFEADGRGSRTYRQVVQVLNQDGAEAWGEQSYSYSSGSEKLTVNWVRVLKPNGEVISAKPAHEQESLAPVAFDAPVYSDQKVRRLTLSGVAPGTLVDWSYTVERLKPLVPGDYYSGWRITTGLLTRRSRLLIDVPASVTPRIHEQNVHFKRDEVQAHGRHVYTWATKDVQKLEGEPFAAVPNTLSVHIDIAAPITWAELARWYANLSAGRYAVSPGLATQLAAQPGRLATRGTPLGIPGFPVRIAVTGDWRLPATPAGAGAGDALRRLQGQGDAVHRARSPHGAEGLSCSVELERRRGLDVAVDGAVRSHDCRH